MHKDFGGADGVFGLEPRLLEAGEAGDVGLNGKHCRGLVVRSSEIPANGECSFGVECGDDGSTDATGTAGDDSGAPLNGEVHDVPRGIGEGV
jgi:hypothetical protein